jgi:two-component system, OmpR family, alkaline phosphatase synthesis response regulator PhoP
MSARTILVVDDEVHIVQVVAIKLRNNGYTVITAMNGAEALLAMQETPCDAVITDYQMPAMTGIELIEHLRADPSTATLPVIMLTARGFAVDKEQKERLAIAHCLSKPFSPKELLASLEETLTTAAVAG